MAAHCVRSRLTRAAIFGFAAALAWPGAASAQTDESTGRYAGIFGRTASATAGQTLDLNWSAVEGHDKNRQAASAAAGTDAEGLHSQLWSGLTYKAFNARCSFDVSVGSGVSYFPDSSILNATDWRASNNFTFGLGRKTRVRSTQTFNRQPYYQFHFLGSSSSTGTSDQTSDPARAELNSDDYDGRVEIERTLGRRTAITVGYGLHLTTVGSEDGRFLQQHADVQLSRGISRHAALRIGYGRERAENTWGLAGPPQDSDTINLGVDYRRALSFSKRTSIAFKSGSTMTSPNGQRQIQIVGTADVSREIGRSWHAAAGYSRSVQHMAGFSDPVLANTADVHVGGFVGRRLEVTTSGSYSSGVLGSRPTDQGYSSLSASGSVRLTVIRGLSIAAQYFGDRYTFDQSVPLPSGVSPRMNRRGLRVGLAGWLPLFR